MMRRTCGLLLGLALAAFALPAWADSFTDAEGRGESLMKAEKYQEAEQAFIEAAKSPEAGTALAARVNAGYCRGAQGDLEGAIAWYESALAIDKDNLNALEGLAGTCFGDKKNYEKGHAYASRAEALYSANPAAYYNLACYYGYKGDAASALKYVDLALYYGFADYQLLSSDGDFAAVRQKEPFKSFQANIRSIQKALALCEKAQAAFDKGDYAQAAQSLQQAADACRSALGPDSLSEASNLATSYLSLIYLRKYSQDLDAQKRALAIFLKRLGPGHPAAAEQYQRVGYCESWLGQHDAAIKDQLAALSIMVAAHGEGSAEARAAATNAGNAYNAKGDYAAAVEYYRKALPAPGSGSAEDAADRAAVETRLGSALAMGARYKEALASYKSALQARLAALGPEHPDVAASYVDLGNTYNLIGDFEGAQSCFEQALAIQTKVLGPGNEATIASSEALGDVAYSRSEFGKALERYRADLELIRKSTGEASLPAAKCYERLAAVEYSLGRYGDASAHYLKARTAIVAALGADNPEEANCLMGLAAVAYTEGRYDDSAGEYAAALAILAKNSGEESMAGAKAYLGMGLSYYSKGENSKAVSYFEKAIPIQRKLGGDFTPDLSRSYLNLSAAYSAAGDTDNAIANINKCIEIQSAIFGEKHLDISVSLKMEGGIYASMGDYVNAENCYRKALGIQTALLGHDHQQVAETLNNLGTVYQGQKRYGEAVAAYRESLEIKKKLFGAENPLCALDYLNIGSAYRDDGDAAAALPLMRTAQELARKSPDRRLAVNISGSLGSLLYTMKRYPEARKAFQEGIGRVEEARRSIGAEKADFMDRSLYLYYMSFETDLAMKDAQAAFSDAESAKARGYLDRLSLGKALGAFGVPAKDRQRMLELSEGISKLANIQLGELAKPSELQDKKTLVSASDRIASMQAEFDRIDEALMSNPRYRELRKPAMVSLKDAQKGLGGDEAYLDYFLYGSGKDWYARCLLIKKSSVTVVDLDASFDYNKAVFELRDAIKAKSKGRDAVSSRLYAALVKPLEGELAGITKLIIVPDESLSLAPFDALRKDGNSPYLCQSYRVTLAPSVSVLMMTASRRYGARKGEWLGLGGVDYGKDGANAEGRGIAVTKAVDEKTKAYYAAQGPKAYFDALGLEWAALPGTEAEVRGIVSQAYGGKATTVLLGREANEAAVKRLSDSGELAQQKIVHFACHAFFDGDYPEYSALVLSEASAKAESPSGETGYLTVEDISLLRFGADLVALSACDTGQGGGYSGDGMVGFARSLLVAGANRAELSLWPVDDAATRDFMIRWYALIKGNGMDYATALAQVKREFIKSGTYTDPAYWSGFVLYGR